MSRVHTNEPSATSAKRAIRRASRSSAPASPKPTSPTRQRAVDGRLKVDVVAAGPHRSAVDIGHPRYSALEMETFKRYLLFQAMMFVFGIVGPIFLIMFFASPARSRAPLGVLVGSVHHRRRRPHRLVARRFEHGCQGAEGRRARSGRCRGGNRRPWSIRYERAVRVSSSSSDPFTSATPPSSSERLRLVERLRSSSSDSGPRRAIPGRPAIRDPRRAIQGPRRRLTS